MKGLDILLVGSGGREHALAWKLSQSPRCAKLRALPGSDGIGQLSECVAGDPLDAAAVVRTARGLGTDLVVVGPEAPLAAGLADALKAAGIRCFGPLKAAARLESSKAFAKDFMKRHRIPTARFAVFDDPGRATDAAADGELPLVVKADGLAGGKGVRVCHTHPEAFAAVREFMLERSLGESGSRVVMEEALEGPELTVMAFCDGKALKSLPPSRDHKRLKDGDRGPNTGGMGAAAPVELPEETSRRVQKEVLDRVLEGLQADRMDYCGILYCGLILTQAGPKVLEFNVRFGDPETQAVLPLLESDLVSAIEACVDGKLDSARFAAGRKHAVSVVLASEGYPGRPETGRRIEGLESVLDGESWVFHAGTRKDPDGWKTAGGRVLDVTALGRTIEEARNRAYAAVAKIRFEGMRYRKDIAAGPRQPAGAGKAAAKEA